MRRLSLEWLAVLAAAIACCVALILTGATARVDNVLYDAALRQSHRPASNEIIIVALDQQSLEDVGAWPWPRAVHAQLLDRLTEAGARAVAYDVLFLEPGPDPAGDQALADAAARAGNLCLPVSIERPGPSGAAYQVHPPLPALAAAASLGHVDTPYDADGVARRAIVRQGDGVRSLPHLMECARLARPNGAHFDQPLPRSDGGAEIVRGAPVLIPFAAASAYRVVPAVSVLRGEVPPEFFKDRYVLVGATAAGLNDRHATPVTSRGGAMPGIELEANLLDGLLTGEVVKQAGHGTQIAVSLVGLLILMLALAGLPPRRALPVGFGLIVALALSAAGLLLARTWFAPFPFVFTALLVFPLWGWRRLEAASRYMLEELQRFSAEPEVLPVRAQDAASGDAVARQIQLMHQTIGRARDLRRFAVDTLRSLPDPTLVVSLHGAILFANPPARLLAGEADATSISLRRFSDGWTDADGGPFAMPRAEEIGESWSRDVQSPTGWPYLATVAPYRDSQGALSAWIVRLTDISELKAAEAQREQIVQLLTHDMRSPQSSIIALLETAPPGAVSDDLAKKLEAYARRTLTLASNFVQLARAGAAVLPFELIDLSDVVTEAIDDLWPQAQKAGIKLVSEGSDEEHLIRGERALLTRTVINLLDNALKYSEAGTTVICRLTEPDRTTAILSVIDQGLGMSDDQMAALSTPYQRFTNSGHKVTDGAGLGLTLVWEVVRRHGGTVQVESTPGSGTAFHLWLPLSRDD